MKPGVLAQLKRYLIPTTGLPSLLNTLCKQRGVGGYAKQALFLAALWHDAAYHEELPPHEKSKEHRSARLAYQAIMYGRPDEDIETRLFAEWVARLIISTHEDHEPTDDMERILNEADFSNIKIGGPAALVRSAAYYVEGLMLAGKVATGKMEDVITERYDDFGEWCEATQAHLSEVVAKKFHESREIFERTIATISPGNVLSALRRQQNPVDAPDEELK